MRQFTACSVLKEKTLTVTSLPLHFLHALLPRVSWSFVLFAFSLHGWEHRTCADYFTESFHHNLSLCLSLLLMSSHCLPLQDVQSRSKLLWMPISRETLHSVSASNVSFSSFPVLGFGFFSLSENCHFDPLSLHFVLTHGAVVRYVGDGEVVENVNIPSVLISAPVTGQMSEECVMSVGSCLEDNKAILSGAVEKAKNRTTGRSL